MTAETDALTRAGRRSHRRRRVSVVGIVGEVLVTVGVVLLLFVGWQLWFGDLIHGAQNNAKGSALVDEWAADAGSPPPPAAGEGTPVTAEPVIRPEPARGEVFGVMRIPRLGDDYNVQLAGGVGTADSLNRGDIGHYPDTAMPGEVGNFAVAAHRGSHGAPFMDLPSLRVGDAVVVETPDGWYTYRFRNLEYVEPSAVEVLLPVPKETGVVATDRFLTMTTCSPRYGSSERVIAYGSFESFTPREAGQPASLTGGVA